MNTTTATGRIYLLTLEGVELFEDCHREKRSAYGAAAMKARAITHIINGRERKGMAVSDTMRANAVLFETRRVEAFEAISCEGCRTLATAPRHSW